MIDYSEFKYMNLEFGRKIGDLSELLLPKLPYNGLTV